MITVTPCRLPPLKSLHPTNRFQWAGPSDFQAICGRGPITSLTPCSNCFCGQKTQPLSDRLHL